MGKLSVFNFITLNGYFKGPDEDISWHKHGDEEREYSEQSLKHGNTLLFGRRTYEMMAGFWRSENAVKNLPVVAEGMNKADKIIFSKTLKNADWSNSVLIADNMIKEVTERKLASKNDMTLLGSGTILTQFAEHNLIDEYQIMVDPVVITNGTTIFNGITHKLSLELTKTRVFKSGVILLCYTPARAE